METSSPSSAGSRVLVVWDFDWSLVNENSDSWVVRQLGEEFMPEFRRLQEQESLGWTQIMNRQMRNLWGKGVNETEIRWSMTRLPVFQTMLEAVCLAQRAGCQQAIVSDANTVFIEQFLAHQGIRQMLTKGVHTNPAVFTEDGRLDVQPYHATQDPPHGCRWCPSNMCKGKILDGLLAVGDASQDRAADKVIYIGDGEGDFCPAIRLRSGDVLLAREAVEGGRSFGLLNRIERHGSGLLSCRLVRWRSGDDVYNAFERELQGLSSAS